MRRNRLSLARASAALIGFELMMAGAAPTLAGDDIVDTSTTRNPPFAMDLLPPDGPGGAFESLGDVDAVATLRGIGIALGEVGDGGSYVWNRRDGLLSGMAQPTTAFKDADGQPCRNLIVILNTVGHSSKIEGVACRTVSGTWRLKG
jgi:surface antigen